MSNNNCSSENYSSPSLENSGHTAITTSSALCSTDVSSGDAPCSPGNSLGSNTLQDKCQELCNEHTSCQSTNCGRVSCSPSGSSPVISDVSPSHQGTSCLPITSCDSSLCLPASNRQLLGCHLPSHRSYSYQPLHYPTFGRQPLSYLGYDRQALRYLTCGCQPLNCLPDSYRPISYRDRNFQPCSSSLSGWRYRY
ncbi:Keratin-associated protein 26-1 [Sciurus carolinensis]|uniref:Keratin-associated protein n=1 Tax=Sciurus carolinensis TaxID=30640 RepID=A0AA41N8P1_SCICA|nr:keratin-associated protein 26-1-like [Sciurus carolinensis]MBZ3885713.1 Keratin-associated protein 26-1 [Sciurus carolinensis]